MHLSPYPKEIHMTRVNVLLVVSAVMLLMTTAYVAYRAGCRSQQSTSSSPRAAVHGEAARSMPYVASAIREPFHRSTCRWAKKIATMNLVGYESREAAIADGHRPCKVCRP